jgi:DNA helicase-2/ATP-dependent DNA helicase PcrA
MNFNFADLNLNQRAAVNWTEGPLLVLAGPGSGKTMVLTCRAAKLLRNDPNASVLALTFTTKAAVEMRERLDLLLGERADRAHLCTFHSFAGDILRQHGSHVGIKPDFTLLTLDEDRIYLLEQVISEMQGDTSTIPADRKNLLVFLDRLFSESYNSDSPIAGLADMPTWVPEFFGRYCETLQKTNRLDYGSLLHFARKLLTDNIGVYKLTRLAWQYVCVDEFQDTNRAQYDLLRCLVPENKPNLFVVADDDQIVYQWNGASPERLRALRQDYGMGIIQLPENFRCPPEIILIANKLIAHNKTRTVGKEPLIARKSAGESHELILQMFGDESAELGAIPKIIREMGWNPDECAVIARSTKLLERAAKAISENGLVPFLAQRKNEFECPSVRWIHAVLRLGNARHDRELLRRMCNEWLAFTDVLIEAKEVEAMAALMGGDFLRAWVVEAARRIQEGDHGDLLNRVKDNLVENLFFVKLLEWFWSKRWLDDPTEQEEMKTWQMLHGLLMREHLPENVSLHQYLQEIDMNSKAPPHAPGSVRCLTVHGAKGLEFDHVFLVGMADEVFPSYQAVNKGDDSREMEEERRNCFVAITRVKQSLHVSFACSYNGYKKKPSRFIVEMGLRISQNEI